MAAPEDLRAAVGPLSEHSRGRRAPVVADVDVDLLDRLRWFRATAAAALHRELDLSGARPPWLPSWRRHRRGGNPLCSPTCWRRATSGRRLGWIDRRWQVGRLAARRWAAAGPGCPETTAAQLEAEPVQALVVAPPARVGSWLQPALLRRSGEAYSVPVTPKGARRARRDVGLAVRGGRSRLDTPSASVTSRPIVASGLLQHGASTESGWRPVSAHPRRPRGTSVASAAVAAARSGHRPRSAKCPRRRPPPVAVTVPARMPPAIRPTADQGGGAHPRPLPDAIAQAKPVGGRAGGARRLLVHASAIVAGRPRSGHRCTRPATARLVGRLGGTPCPT